MFNTIPNAFSLAMQQLMSCNDVRFIADLRQTSRIQLPQSIGGLEQRGLPSQTVQALRRMSTPKTQMLITLLFIDSLFNRLGFGYEAKNKLSDYLARVVQPTDDLRAQLGEIAQAYIETLSTQTLATLKESSANQPAFLMYSNG